MTDIEKLIKLLEHAESFSLEAYGKSPNLSECSLNIQYLRACILQAIGNAKALRERLAPQKREWQGLIDEEYNRLVMEHLGPHALTGGKMSVYDAFLLAIRATEAKLKEKNT